MQHVFLRKIIHLCYVLSSYARAAICARREPFSCKPVQWPCPPREGPHSFHSAHRLETLKSSRRPRRLSGDARRQELIDAAIQSLAKHGNAGATIETICSVAGASTGLIRYHFGSKGQLLAEAYRHIAKKFMAAVTAAEEGRSSDPLSQLQAFIDVIHDPTQLGDELASAWFGLWHAAKNDPDLLAINREWYAEYRAYLTRLIQRAARQRGVAVNAEQVAYGLIALTDGFWQELMIDPNAFDPALARTISLDYVDRLFTPSTETE